jgi:hypothetical protein
VCKGCVALDVCSGDVGFGLRVLVEVFVVLAGTKTLSVGQYKFQLMKF